MDALDARRADDDDDVGGGDGRAGQEVALLDVDRAGLGLALEVGVDVGHDER